MSEETHFKSPLDAEIAKHGRRYGFLVYFAKHAIQFAFIKHMSSAAPYHHNKDGHGPIYDESCIRCTLEKALEHAERDGWVGLEWKGEERS